MRNGTTTIVGANTQSYTITPADVDCTIHVEVIIDSINFGSNEVEVWRKIDDETDMISLPIPSVRLAANYILTDHINLTSAWVPRYLDTGYTFDGNGKTITFNAGIAGSSHFGLFTDNEGTIQNLRLASASPLIYSIGSSTNYTGAVAAVNQSTGIIKNVCSTVSFNVTITTSSSFNSIGGITGSNSGIIENCYVVADIKITPQGTDPGYAGGIAGDQGVVTALISNCWASGTVEVNSYDPNSCVGGIAGDFGMGQISNCVALQGSLIQGTVLGFTNRIAVGVTGFLNNYANSGMMFSSFSVLPFPAPSGTVTDEDGGDVTLPASDDWWKTSGVGWDTVGVWGGADEDHPWVWGSGRPKLWFE